MPLTYKQKLELVAHGAGLDLDATELSYAQLKELAAHAGGGDADSPHGTLRIKNADALTFLQLKEIAAYGRGKVFLDLE